MSDNNEELIEFVEETPPTPTAETQDVVTCSLSEDDTKKW